MRKLLAVSLTLFALGVAAPPAPALAAPSASIVVNGLKLQTPMPPIFANDRLLVPIRVVAESLGAQVHWDPQSRRVTVWNDLGQRIDLTIGQKQASVNGQPRPLDTPALIQQDRTYLPLRFVGEMLGAQVAWNGTSRQATLTTSQPSSLNGIQLSDVLDLSFAGGQRPQASGFLMQSPNRVIVDLQNTQLPPTIGGQLPGQGPVLGVRLLPKEHGSLRVVLDVDRPLYPRLEATPNGYRVRLVETALAGRKIYLDPGHGGSDPGAIHNGVIEKEANLVVAQRLKGLLEAQGAQVMIARDDDTFVSLAGRAQAANRWGAEAFVSLHHNANGLGSIDGSQTYYHPRDGGSSGLAALLHQALLDATGQPDRGIRQADFAVTRLTNMPAVLVEVAFLTNPGDAAKVQDPLFQQQVAEGLRVGLNNFFLGR